MMSGKTRCEAKPSTTLLALTTASENQTAQYHASTTTYWAFSIVTSGYNQVIKMKIIILVVAICLLQAANSGEIVTQNQEIWRLCLGECTIEYRSCTYLCVKKSTTLEEEMKCQELYTNYFGEDCVRDECFRVCITEASQCNKDCYINAYIRRIERAH
ncbi:hypothetical protein LSAT2_026481 [Lamellibrachia satsuma]|nr:hypothetical protein LSAT2_026481 [Lamellibrachia satsuma]